MFGNYKRDIKAGQDALDPEMKKARIEHKARMLEGNIISDDELLEEAHQRAKENEGHSFGPIDPGPLTD